MDIMTRRERKMSRTAAAFALAGGSQTVIADAIGVSQSYVSRVLSGDKPKPPYFDVALRAHIGRDAAQPVIDAMEATT